MSDSVIHTRSHGSNKEAEAQRVSRRRTEAQIVSAAVENAVKRDPCFNCGIRFDQHDELGCKRWIGGAL